jgi:hypothetical protein
MKNNSPYFGERERCNKMMHFKLESWPIEIQAQFCKTCHQIKNWRPFESSFHTTKKEPKFCLWFVTKVSCGNLVALDCRLTLHHISHKILALNTRTIGIGGFFKKHRYQFLNFQHSRMDERLHMHEYFSSMFLAHVDNIGHWSARNEWMFYTY